jgi:hypothetical protein
MSNPLVAIFGGVLCLCVVSGTGVSQTTTGTALPNKSILYTGELDGLLGSWKACPSPTNCQTLIDRKARELAKYKTDKGAILLGTGDNFGLASDTGQYDPVRVMAQHKAPNPAMNNVVRFMFGAYDAVVPGKEDFAFGPQFLLVAAEQSGPGHEPVPLLAGNLTIQVEPSPDCFAYPSPTSSLPLLPNQVSNPIASSSSGSGGGASTGGSSSGGGKGKKGGGGSSSSGAAAGGASSSAAGATSGATAGGAAGGAGGCGAGGSGSKPPAKGQSKTSHPTLAWPAASAIYPWTASIAVSLQGADAPPPEAYMCPDLDPKNSDAVPIPSRCVKWTNQPSDQPGSFRYELLDKERIHVDRHGKIKPTPDPTTPSTGVLYEGNSVKFCFEKATNPPSFLCTTATLTVQRTLFQQVWIAKEGYVVLGALAPDTLNGLSAVDKEWGAEGKDPQMQVSVGDPTAALTQALSTYDRLNPSANSTGVVLAQMTPAEAKSLADSLSSSRTRLNQTSTQVNLIVSAADAFEATPYTSITLPSDVKHGRFIPVVTPAPIFQKKNCFADFSGNGMTDTDRSSTLGECVAEVDFSAAVQRGMAAIKMDNAPAAAAFSPDTSRDSTADSPLCVGSTATSWECKLLDRMRKAVHDERPDWDADVSILERKDFDYVRAAVTPGQTQFPCREQALRALWNAGNLTRVTLLGSTLMSILQQSTSNQAQNFQSLASVRQSEQLRVMGIFEQSGVYYIKGVPLDTTKLYAVATSDNLANSSSDYSSLASQDQNLPEVFWDYDKTISIADLAGASAIGQTANPVLKAQIEAVFPNQVTANDIVQAKAKVVPFAADLTHSTRTISLEPSSTQDLGMLAQTEPFWHVTIQQMSFGYTDSKPSQSDPLIGTNFGGVSNPNVVTPHSNTISLVYDARTEYYRKRGLCAFCLADLGADVQVNFTRSAQGSTTPAPALPPVSTSGALVPTTSVAFPSNTYVVSPFLEMQTKVASFWKPLVFRPGLFTTQVASVKQYLASSTTATTTTPAIQFQLDQKRTFTSGGGLGTRFESSDFNYLEFGYSFQRSFEVLSGVSEPGQTVCPLTNTMTVAKCASTLPGIAGVPLSAYYSDYSQNGGYLLWMLTKPFWAKPVGKTLLLYQLTAYGNFFAYARNAPSSALTRYAFAMNNTFQITLPANFTFGPSYNLFYFQANQHQIGASLHRQSFSAQLSYAFDWHTGLSLHKALVGKVQ